MKIWVLFPMLLFCCKPTNNDSKSLGGDIRYSETNKSANVFWSAKVHSESLNSKINSYHCIYGLYINSTQLNKILNLIRTDTFLKNHSNENFVKFDDSDSLDNNWSKSETFIYVKNLIKNSAGGIKTSPKPLGNESFKQYVQKEFNKKYPKKLTAIQNFTRLFGANPKPAATFTGYENLVEEKYKSEFTNIFGEEDRNIFFASIQSTEVKKLDAECPRMHELTVKTGNSKLNEKYSFEKAVASLIESIWLDIDELDSGAGF